MDTKEHWSRARFTAAAYDSGVQNERVARLLGRLMWGTDVRAMYDGIAELGALPAGSSVLDVPCGGGVAFRGLPGGHSLNYVAVDLSPVMLDRARAEADRRGLSGIRFMRASVEDLPFETNDFDTCVTYNGLHCFPDPAAAIAEMARVVRPGGTLRGTMVVKGRGLRQDAAIGLLQRMNSFGPGGSEDDLKRWLVAAGIADAVVQCDGALAHFTGQLA